MAQFKILHGCIKVGEHYKAVGDVVELSEAEAKAMDPAGTCLKAKADYEAEQLGEKAKVEAIATALKPRQMKVGGT